jgi:hypothetical protein
MYGAGGTAQGIEHLPRSLKPWVQTPVSPKKKKKIICIEHVQTFFLPLLSK